MKKRRYELRTQLDNMFNHRTLWITIVFILVFLSPLFVLGASCSFIGVTSINFGAYEVFALSPNNSGVGTMSVSCRDTTSSVVVSLSTGQSNTYLSREMMSGPHRLYYNLFTNASRTTVWGNGNGISSTMAINSNNTTATLNIFGQIPERQDANVGVYMDNIIVTVDF